jgi:hypothetical protein
MPTTTAKPARTVEAGGTAAKAYATVEITATLKASDMSASTVEAATMEGAAATTMEGAAATAMKTATTTAMAAATRALCEGRTGRRDGQGRQCTNYEPTQFSACHDSSPSFL